MQKFISRPVTALVMVVLAMSLGGCYGIPDGTQKITHVGKLQLQIKGAGLVKADTEKTTYLVKCRGCGYEAEETSIDTPSVGSPYSLNWVCPRCRHKQTIMIEASGL